MTRVLVLAGTSEARELIGELAQDQRFEVQASLAGATRTPADLGVPTHVGGYGGSDGLRAFLSEQSIDVLVDATHPFAAQMTQNAAAAVVGLPVRHVILQRPEWVRGSADNWTFVDDFQEVAKIVPTGSTVFLGTGRQTLHQFEGLQNSRLLCRVIDPPQKPFPFPDGDFIVGRPPFSVAEEIALFTDLGVDYLVVKNSGGTRSFSKLQAAREMSLPVILQRRPPLPNSDVVESVVDCLAWLG